MIKTMKAILTILATLLVSPLCADEARLAALEAKVAILETQNLSLKAAIEAISGKPLSQILGGASAPSAATAPAVAPPTASEPLVLGVPVAQAKARLAQLEEHLAALTKAHESAYKEATKPRDPFKESGGVRKSKADAEKEAGIRLEEISRVKAQADALRGALASH